MSNRAKGDGKRFSTSLIIGLLLVPLSAVAAVALVNPDATAESDETVAAEVVATTTTTQAVDEYEVPEIASAGDLELACGDEGMELAFKEGEGTITALEQAALDSLRAICEAEGLPLPGPPAPEAVVETVTVVAAPASDAASSDSDDDDDLAAEFEEEYAETVAYINAAIADGAHGDMIALAEQLVGEAAALADSGDFEGGMAKLSAARDAADMAERGHHDDHDDDDEDEDDDDEDEDEDEDEEHDEEDEEDDDEEDD